ncbi:tetratricopeptide repeat protein [Streptomyces aidingensis]|uniref:tetratricopeptide repeat protein n=1 Tax=Streptomyces aidingensis TaxID=910347 RepID=UPI001FEB704F|nr:tetratricopeptide repeat protein [Streptomyces aidingensis]
MLNGLGGIGKTELAFQLGRTLLRGDPGYQVLYVDLDELRDAGALDAMDALGHLLDTLDSAEALRAHSYQARCKQYWRLTRNRRLVLIIDNARFGTEVTPLLPASGTAVVLVTSQGPLPDLDDAAAVDLPLSLLGPQDALELLRSVSSDPRLAAEPEAVRGLVRLCSGLPEALRVAGRWVNRHRLRPLDRLVREFGAGLEEQEMSARERSWDMAYGSLGPAAAHLYRLLADLPGPTLTVESSTALLGQGEDAAVDALEELHNAGLLNVRGERFPLPVPLRAHALRWARREADSADRAQARGRILRWFLRQAQRADLFAAGERMTFAPPVPPLPGAPDVTLADPRETDDKEEIRRRRAQAARWLHAERHALFACVDLAGAPEFGLEAAALAEPLWTHFLDHPHHARAIRAFRAGRDAALRTGNLALLLRMRCQLARPLWEQDRFDEAAEELAQAEAAAALLGEEKEEQRLKASLAEFQGRLHAARGQWEEAAGRYSVALQVHQRIENPYGVMLQTYQLGTAAAGMGRTQEAAGLLSRAHEMARELGRERMTARTGFALAGVLRSLDRKQEAAELYQAALDSARARESEHDRLRILEALAALAAETGDTESAARHREAARSIREQNGLEED